MNAVARHLANLYHTASPEEIQEGLLWYRHANWAARQLGKRYGVGLESVAGVIAALSPMYEWDRNLADAERLIAAYARGARGSRLPMVGALGRKNRHKAVMCLRGKEPLKVLGGQKVTSFYRNLVEPKCGDAVTIDRHAKCAALGITKDRDRKSEVGIVEYRNLAQAYKTAAEAVGVVACELQAVIWVSWRNQWKGVRTK